VGSPKFNRRTFDRPSHPWQAERIASENELNHKYGLKNKKEIWKAETLLRNFRRNGRLLLARSRSKDEQALKEAKQLITRLTNLGFVPEDTTLDGILALDVNVVLGRRLQTLVYLKGLAGTPKQARQFIVHGHVSVNGRTVTVPGYIVSRKEENSIIYAGNSPLKDELHPMRPSAEEEIIVPEGQFEHNYTEDERGKTGPKRGPRDSGKDTKPGKDEEKKDASKSDEEKPAGDEVKEESASPKETGKDAGKKTGKDTGKETGKDAGKETKSE